MDLSTARTPNPGYESHYLVAGNGCQAVWVRHTTLDARPTLWVTFWDSGTAQQLRADQDLPPTLGKGSLEGLSWDLTWQAQAPELPYLPARWLYDKPFPRSNGVALVPHATFDGTVADVAVDGWTGMVGHNWGRDHADAWCWLHGTTARGWWDLILVRIPPLTSWVAAGAVHQDGVTSPIRRRGAVLVTNGVQTDAQVRTAAGPLSITVHAPPERTVHWDYASPEPPGRDVTNCSVAHGSMTFRGETLAARAVVEHGHPSGA
jgi:hypothetical protein